MTLSHFKIKIAETLYLASQSKPVYLSLAAFLFFGIFFTDWISHHYVSLALFYLMPILIMTWWLGKKAGIVVSLVSILSSLAMSFKFGHHYDNDFYQYLAFTEVYVFYLSLVWLMAFLKSSLDKEVNMARTDALTELMNRRAFFEQAEMEIDRSRRFERPFILAYIDLDNFKWVNDNLGHKTGDLVLKKTAQVMRKVLRKTDLIGRLGGDEFIILLPELNENTGQFVVGKLQESLLTAMKEKKWPITFSIGMTAVNPPIPDVTAVVAKADSIMYKAKNGGKNRIVVG